MRKYKFNQKLEVQWIDMVEDPAWTGANGMEKRPDADCMTLGYYYGHSKEFLFISHTISGKERSKTSIPLGVIKKIRIQKDK